jgi:hypothetical protein
MIKFAKQSISHEFEDVGSKTKWHQIPIHLESHNSFIKTSNLTKFNCLGN